MSKARKKRDVKLHHNCVNCGKKMGSKERVLFVEEILNRTFCSEECISGFFSDQVEALEKRFKKYRPKSDLAPAEREKYAHLRWVTLQNPDEVWEEQLPSGDVRYTLISEFQPGKEKIWSVAVCLLLQGEPSFLFLSFPTRSKSLVDRFRKHIQVERLEDLNFSAPFDGLADHWSETDALRAKIHEIRPESDFPTVQFSRFAPALEKTLEEPSEVWKLEGLDEAEPSTYHFIRRFEAKELVKEPFWYVVIGRETGESDQLEILEAFPTKFESVVRNFRKGSQEKIDAEADLKMPEARVVH